MLAEKPSSETVGFRVLGTGLPFDSKGEWPERSPELRHPDLRGDFRDPKRGEVWNEVDVTDRSVDVCRHGSQSCQCRPVRLHEARRLLRAEADVCGTGSQVLCAGSKTHLRGSGSQAVRAGEALPAAL